MIFASFFHVFIVDNWEKCPRGGVLARFYRPRGGGFELLVCPGGGEFAHQKNCPGGWSGLELADTLQELKKLGKYEYFFRVYHNKKI